LPPRVEPFNGKISSLTAEKTETTVKVLLKIKQNEK